MHAMLWVGLRSLRWWGCSRQLHWFTWTTTEDLSNQTIDQKWSEAVCVRVGFKTCQTPIPSEVYGSGFFSDPSPSSCMALWWSKISWIRRPCCHNRVIWISAVCRFGNGHGVMGISPQLRTGKKVKVMSWVHDATMYAWWKLIKWYW